MGCSKVFYDTNSFHKNPNYLDWISFVACSFSSKVLVTCKLYNADVSSNFSVVVTLIHIRVVHYTKCWSGIVKNDDISCKGEGEETKKLAEEAQVFGLDVKLYYYSFKIFPQFWLAKSTNLEEFYVWWGNDSKNAACYRLRHRYQEDLGTRLSCFGCENKNGVHFTILKRKLRTTAGTRRK